VDLAEQVFGANHARSRLANEINEWYPISEKINEDIKRACIEHGHVAVNRKLPKDDITGFAQAPIVLLQYLLGAGILEDLMVGE
ncbi:18006_t:CDS:2, partial [Gigaspora margarita]